MSVDTTDYTAALIDGPWRHEFVPANGSRFHVALAGPPDEGGSRTKPLVVLLHSFPQFWWAWRHQLTALSDAGHRVAAVDLRGTGASDKPPIGYDVPTRTRDVAGIVRSLGHDQAIVVGHGAGGLLAWAVAALQPAVTAAVGALSAPHPARIHVPGRRLLTQRAVRRLAFFQVPTLPERALRSGSMVADVLAEAAAVGWDPNVVDTYETVMRIPFAAHTALESLRWAVRSTPRPDGRRFQAAVRRPLTIPALQVHGDRDGYLKRDFVEADAAALARDLRFEVVEGAGHYLPEEAPQEISNLLIEWIAKAV